MLEGLGDGALRDLVERDPSGLRPVELDEFRHVPRDRLALPIGVRRQPHVFRVLRGLLDRSDRLLRVRLLERFVRDTNAAVHVDAEVGFGQITDVAHRREDLEVLAHVLLDRLRLGRRLDDHEVLGHVVLSRTGRW